jgi:hypothetical protein
VRPLDGAISNRLRTVAIVNEQRKSVTLLTRCPETGVLLITVYRVRLVYEQVWPQRPYGSQFDVSATALVVAKTDGGQWQRYRPDVFRTDNTPKTWGILLEAIELGLLV